MPASASCRRPRQDRTSGPSRSRPRTRPQSLPLVFRMHDPRRPFADVRPSRDGQHLIAVLRVSMSNTVTLWVCPRPGSEAHRPRDCWSSGWVLTNNDPPLWPNNTRTVCQACSGWRSGSVPMNVIFELPSALVTHTGPYSGSVSSRRAPSVESSRRRSGLPACGPWSRSPRPCPTGWPRSGSSGAVRGAFAARTHVVGPDRRSVRRSAVFRRPAWRDVKSRSSRPSRFPPIQVFERAADPDVLRLGWRADPDGVREEAHRSSKVAGTVGGSSRPAGERLDGKSTEVT